MSIGFEVRTPHDLQGKGVFTIAGDPISPAVFAAVGGLTPRSLAVPEILAHLGTDVNVLTVPPLVAEQLQWASRITHINTTTTAFGIGGFIMSSSRLKGAHRRAARAVPHARQGRERHACRAPSATSTRRPSRG